jgi:AAA-like domain/Trypsin-like peptidase domain
MVWDLIKACTIAIADSGGNIRGTGFFVSREGYLFTCAHVVEDAGGWEGVRINGEGVELVYLGDAALDDFAVLKVPKNQDISVPLSLSFAPRDDFLSIGFGRADFPEGGSIEGSITDENHHAGFGNLPMLRLRVLADSQQIIGGYSGSPLFDVQSQAVVGIVAAYDNNDGGLAVPLKTVAEKWAELERLLFPQAAANLEVPDGIVPLESRFYIERFTFEQTTRTNYVAQASIESKCVQEVIKPGSLISIKAPHQMGKKSLLTRVIHRVNQESYATVCLNLQLADEKAKGDLDIFLKWFAASVGRHLKLPNKFTEYWDDGIFGSKDNCTAYFEDYLLAEISQPLVLVLSEVDCLFAYPETATNFFALLRAWHEAANNIDIWQKLRLVLVHATEPYIEFNRNQSPFNVGLPVKLTEFNALQVENLAQLHGLNWHQQQNENPITKIMNMLGGHPYLIRVALYHIAMGDISLDEFIKTAPTEEGYYSKHLLRQLWNLEQQPQLKEAMKKVILSNKPVRLDSVTSFKLYSMGLVKQVGNDVEPRCNLYRLYLCDRFNLI